MLIFRTFYCPLTFPRWFKLSIVQIRRDNVLKCRLYKQIRNTSSIFLVKMGRGCGAVGHFRLGIEINSPFFNSVVKEELNCCMTARPLCAAPRRLAAGCILAYAAPTRQRRRWFLIKPHIVLFLLRLYSKDAKFFLSIIRNLINDMFIVIFVSSRSNHHDEQIRTLIGPISSNWLLVTGRPKM